MATKDSFTKDKHKTTFEITNSTSYDPQYKNLNLNQSNFHQAGHVQLKSSSVDSSKKFNDDNHCNNNSSPSTPNNSLLDKNDKKLKPFEYLDLQSDQKKFSNTKSLNDNNKTSSSSTLSLHISAYENSTEVGNSTTTNLEHEKIQQQKSKNWKDAASNGEASKIFQDFFEFPRQQNNEEGKAMEPEIMQFKASQKLLSPNSSQSNESIMSTQSSSEQQQQLDSPPPLIQGAIITSDDDEENIILPKKVRKKLLIDSDDDEAMSVDDGGEKDIEEEEDLESENNSDEESLSGDEAEDDESMDSEEGAEDDDEEDDESDASESSLLSFDSEFSWNEFQYIDDNAENSFIQDEEESIRERYNTVMKLLLSEQAEEGFDSLSILYEEPLIQKQLTTDFSSFDWEKAKAQFVKSCEPKMRMITFGITRALARFATDPTLFYLQALSLRPTDKALWYEFGCSSAKIHNFKTAELAFKQCSSPHSDAGIKLAIVYFYSKDYHKCLPLLREQLTARPSNLALWVLKAEISKINTFWKYFVELYFPSNSLFFQEPTIPTDIYEKVLQEINSFETTEPPTEKFRSDYSLQPLLCEPIRLNLEQSMEKFAEFLCKYFDQSSKQQLPFQQTVHFAKEKRHHHHSQHRRNMSSLSGSIKERTPPPEESDSMLSISMNDEVDATCSTVIDDMVSIAEDVEAVVKKLVDDVVKGKIPKLAAKPKRRPPRKAPNLSLDVRRSGRTSKEIPFEAMDSPVIGTFQPPTTNSEPVTIRTLLDLPSGDSTFPPLDFPGAKGFPLDDLKYNIIPPFTLETFNVYLTTLLNKQHVPMEELLQTFLYFFSWNLPAGCILTEQQRKLFLEVYIRWTDTFCQPFHQHCLNASIKDISIHLLAAELDVAEKLKAAEACEIIFGGRFSGIFQKQPESIARINITQNGEMQETISEKAMRNKAITLLSEVDPDMAAKIKSCIEDSRISTKIISKETNIEDAIGALTFSRDDYYSGGLKTVKPKVKKSTATIIEPKEMPSIELLDKDERDATTLISFNLTEASPSESTTTTPKLSKFNTKFIPLWADLSKIMQRVVKSTPKEIDATEQREMSPMDETDMISLLNNCPDLSDEDENIYSLKEIQKVATDNSTVEKLLQEYLALLESFVHENKYKKEIESGETKSFFDETKKAIEAMKAVMSQDAVAEEEDIQMDESENEKLREMAIRFYWLKLMKLNNDDAQNVELKKAYLSTILHLIELDTPIYTQLLDENERCTVITAKMIVKILMNEFRKEKVTNISKLIAAEKHQEVIEQFTTDFNWYSCDEKEVIKNIQILLFSFEAVKDRKGPIEWICRLLDCVISGKFETRRDDIYTNSLKQLGLLSLEEIDHDILKLLAKRLVVCSEYDRFKKNVMLWKILYRVASILEGTYDENSRIEMYQSIEAIKILLPTKALCLLAEGHRILGEEHHCCTINDGELLYFFIDELYKNFYEHRFEDHYYSKMVQRNIELQLIQCFRCLFDSSVGKSVVYDHECSKSFTPNLALAKKVQPFLIPTLPMFDDEKFTTNDVIEALTRVFPWIENEKMSGFDEAWTNFEAFIKDPPFFKFQIVKNELQPIGDFEKANLWPCIEITDENREKLELFVYLRYVLLVIKYKKQAYTWEENEKLAQLAKECLVLSGPPERSLLPVKVIHSLWAICAYTHTMYFCYLEDDELAKQANSYFYMFKMAFLQYPEAFQLHIDIAVAYYQINSRIRRHKRSLSNKSLPDEFETKIAQEDLIKQCQLHFNQFRYRISQTNEYPKDISWIEAYFSGKLAEHEGKAAAEIFEHYYRCAMLMRSEAYTYPLRVNKTSQENVEPLELHYRVHVYAMKQIFALEDMKPFEKRVEHLKIIQHYLRLFLGHFIFAKKNPPALPAIDTALAFVDSTPPWDFEEKLEIVDEGEEYFDDDIQDTLELMVSYTDLRIECLEYCRRAFETIVKRFPHYKSYYQLALLHLLNKEFQKGLDVIFIKLFKGKFVSFEKVTDIERTDIERSDTLAYHLRKLIRLTLALLKKCRDIPKTNLILEDLVKESSTGRLKLKDNEREQFITSCLEIYQEAVVKIIRKKDIDQLNSMAKLLEKASTILRINKKSEADEKIKLLIARCRNVIRSIFDAREKQRSNELARVQQQRNSELATTQLQAIMEMQKAIAAKQKQELANKIQQVAEEQARKQREEDERKKRAAEAEKKKKEAAMSEGQRNLLAYQKMMEAKRAEEAKKAAAAEAAKKKATTTEAAQRNLLAFQKMIEDKKVDDAKKAEILKLAVEKLNRICNNPLLLPDVRKNVQERRPALLEALKINVANGESLATLITQLDRFDNNLSKAPPAVTAAISVPPAKAPSASSAQQVQRNGSHASSSVPNKQQQTPAQPLNLSTTTSSYSTAVSKPQASSTPSKAVTQKVHAQQKTPPKVAAPPPSQPRNTLQTPSPKTTTPQKSPQPSTSKASTPSKSSIPVDTIASREQMIGEIGKLIQQYAPSDMKEFDRLKPSMLQKTTLELQQVYSTMFVKYICGKASSTPSVPSTSSTSGKRTAAQISPSVGSNVAPKIRRTDNSATSGTPSRPSPQLGSQQQKISSTTAVSSTAASSTVSQSKAPQVSQQQSSTTATVSQSHQVSRQSSTAATVPPSKPPQASQQQQQQQYRFDHLTEQVKKVIPKPIPSSTTSTSTAASVPTSSTPANKSASDDDILIIGETKGPSSLSSTPTSTAVSDFLKATATPKSALTMARRFLAKQQTKSTTSSNAPVIDLVDAPAAAAARSSTTAASPQPKLIPQTSPLKPPTQPTATSSSRPQQLSSTSARSHQTSAATSSSRSAKTSSVQNSSSKSQKPSSSRQQQQQRPRFVVAPSTSTAATAAPSTSSSSTTSNINATSAAQIATFNVLVQQQMRHLLQSATSPQHQQQILQAFLSTYNNQQQQNQPSSSSSTNRKR